MPNLECAVCFTRALVVDEGESADREGANQYEIRPTITLAANYSRFPRAPDGDVRRGLFANSRVCFSDLPWATSRCTYSMRRRRFAFSTGTAANGSMRAGSESME